MALELLGIHHLTAVSAQIRDNHRFYTQALGMRLVKKTVNQDVPDTYHLFYADADGNPGTDLTFFPWADSPPVQDGIGLAMEVSLAIPSASVPYWRARLTDFGVAIEAESVRHAERTLAIRDPFGQPLALVATDDARTFAAWDRSPVPAEHQIRGLQSVRLWERDLALTEEFLVNVLGFRAMGVEDGWHRYGVGDG